MKDVCKDVLNEVGIKAKDGKKAREDLVFIRNNEHFLIEVKGCEKSANKSHVKQVESHKKEYTDENEIVVKGILLINAWRRLPLEERNTADRPIFPNEIMKLVNLYKICLMTTQQLFVIYCKQLEGNFDLNTFIEKLKNSNGRFEGFNNINSYKKINNSKKVNSTKYY